MLSILFAVVGIMGAMPEEISLLTQDLKNHQEVQIGPRTYHTGTLYGTEAVVVYPCVGKVASASVATTLIHRFHVDQLFFSGTAGAADSQLQVGDIVIADRLVQHDLDARPFFKQFEVPFLNESVFFTDPSLVEAAYQTAESFLDNDMNGLIDAASIDAFSLYSPQVYIGGIASGDQFIADPLKIQEICRLIPGTLCVEMEGAAVAHVCFENQIPFLIFRVISDRADHSAPVDFLKFVRKIANSYSKGLIQGLIYQLN